MSMRVVTLLVAVVALVAFGLGRGCAPSPADAVSRDHDHGGEVVYTCSMHPQVRQPEPGDCPLCGMALVPASEVGADEGADVVRLSDRAQRLARLRTAPLRSGSPDAAVTLSGRLVPADDRRAAVIAWTGGRVERLRVRARGDVVRRGQVIADLYSPEVLVAHADLRAAHAQVAAAGPTAPPVVTRAYDGARQRLALLGVPDDTLDALAEEPGPLRRVPIRSPFAGTVLVRQVTEGDEVSPGQVLLEIADLSVVWAELDAPASALERLRQGDAAWLHVDGLPVAISGEVLLVEPVVDAERRLGRVRVALPNPDGRLRPGLVVRAEVTPAAAASGLWAPSTAVYQTGERAIVYVEEQVRDRTVYEAREVRVGARTADRVELLAGVAPGERVVVHGAFVLDADMQLRGGRSLLTLPDTPDPFAQALDISSADRARLRPMLDAYLRVQRALGDDDLDAAAQAARAVVRGAELSLDGEAEAVWVPLRAVIRDAAEALASEGDIERARVRFHGLAASIQTVLERLGNPLDVPLHIAYCPMTFDDGATWVQEGERIHNAYQGERMLRCGEIRGVVAPGAVLGRSE